MENPVMQKIEKASIGIVFGAIPVIIGFLTGWWSSIPFVPESLIYLFALGGLVMGIVIDMLFLSDWIRRAYSIKPFVWKTIYGVYAVGLFGFFMGVPVFHPLLAVPAGVFVGRWLARTGTDSASMQKVSRRFARFTTGVMAWVCLGSASIGWMNRSTGADLQGMLGLAFPVTPWMVVGIILIGGVSLLILQWWIAIQSVQRAYGYFAGRMPALLLRPKQ